MDKRPLVVVLILSYNGLHLLKDALSSYLFSSYSNLKVVLIDNGSKDKTKDYVKSFFPDVDLFQINDNKGYSGGFNAGINYVKSKYNPDYFLISNNDVIIDSDAVNELVKVAEREEKVGFVTGKVYFFDYKGRKDILQTVGKKFRGKSLIPNHIGSGEVDKGQYDHVVKLEACDDVYILVSKDVIDLTKGYDENFFHENEETDWHLRSKKLGFEIFFSSKAKIWHKLSVTTGGWLSPKIVFYNFRNHILIFKRHGNENQLLFFLFNRIFYRLPISILNYTIKQRFNLITASLRGTMSGIKWLIREKHGVIQ